MKAKALLFIFLSIVMIAKAQTGKNIRKLSVLGTVIDKDSGGIIKGATVILSKRDDTLFRKNTLTNIQGAFIFSGLDYGTYFLTVTNSGYQKQVSASFSLDSLHPVGSPITISITRKLNQLDKVIISTREKSYIQQQTDRITVNINALTANNGSTAFDVLNSAPGVVVNDDGTISLRGKEGVIVYIDDKPSYLSPTNLEAYLRSLPAAQLDKIELMPNPPARYNAEGSAGIINIQTKKLKKKGWNGNLSSAYSQGRYPKFNESANLNYAQGKLNLYGSAVYSAQNNFYHVDRSRSYDYPDDAMNYLLLQQNNEINKRRMFTYRAGADYDLNKRTVIGIMFNGLTSPYHEEGQYRSEFTKAGATDSTLYSNSLLKTQTSHSQANLYFHHAFSRPEQELNISLDYLNHQDHQHQLLQTTTELSADSSKQNIPLVTDIHFLANIYSARADYSQPLSSFVLESGAQTIYTNRNNKAGYFDQLGTELQPVASLNNSFRYKEHIDALYVNLKKEWKRFSAQAGLRLERTTANAASYDMIAKPDSSFSLQYTNLFPTLYITYQTDSTSRHLFNLSAGRRITRPNYQDLNPSSFFFDRNTSFTGNPLLQPELSTNLELSYTYNKVWSSGITYSHSRGMIIQAYQQAGMAYISSTRNIDHVYGIDIHSNLSIAVNKVWTANLNAQITSNWYKGVLFDVPVDTRGGFFRITAYNQFNLGKGWSADITTLYRGRLVLAQAVLKPTWQMHASVQKKISDRSVISLAGRDLFYTSVFQRTVTIPGVVAFSANRSDSRYVSLTFTYKFGSKASNRLHKTGIESEQSRVGG